MADVDIFMDFLVLEEQLKMLGNYFFVTGLFIIKRRPLPLYISVCSIKTNFPAVTVGTTIVGGVSFAKT